MFIYKTELSFISHITQKLNDDESKILKYKTFGKHTGQDCDSGLGKVFLDKKQKHNHKRKRMNWMSSKLKSPAL